MAVCFLLFATISCKILKYTFILRSHSFRICMSNNLLYTKKDPLTTVFGPAAALTSKIYSVYIKSVFWLFCSLYLTDSPQKSRTSPLPFYCTFLFDRYLPSSPPFLNCIQILLVFFSLIRIHFLLFACFSTHSAGAGAFAACSPLLSSTASPMLL